MGKLLILTKTTVSDVRLTSVSSGSGLSANNDTSVCVSWSVNSASKSSSKATEEEVFHDSNFRER